MSEPTPRIEHPYEPGAYADCNWLLVRKRPGGTRCGQPRSAHAEAQAGAASEMPARPNLEAWAATIKANGHYGLAYDLSRYALYLERKLAEPPAPQAAAEETYAEHAWAPICHHPVGNTFCTLPENHRGDHAPAAEPDWAEQIKVAETFVYHVDGPPGCWLGKDGWHCRPQCQVQAIAAALRQAERKGQREGWITAMRENSNLYDAAITALAARHYPEEP